MFFHKSDKELIDQALSGSESAWLKLVQRYESLLFNHFLRLVNEPNDALDLVQEVFLGVFRQMPNFRKDASFKTWLFKIASNKFVDYIRRKKIAEPLEEQLDSLSDPMHQVSSNQRNALVKAMMQTLPTEQRLIVELKFFQQFTFDEISEQLNIPVNTVKTRLYKVLKRIKPQLEQEHVL